MRKFRFLGVALLGMSTMFVTSCEPDEEDPLKPKPTLEVTVDGDGEQATNDDITVEAGSDLAFYINAVKPGGGSDLNTFEITTSLVNNLQLTSKDYDYNSGAVNLKNADDEQYVDTLMVDGVFLANAGTYGFQFTVKDKDGQSKVVDIQVTVTKSVALSDETTGAFFHIQGTATGAYDLVAKQPVAGGGSSADPTVQDMKNTDGAGDPFTGSWTAGNATMFVKVASFDYDNATDASAATAYAAGTETANINDPAVDDIVIAKLRGGSDYAVIKVTDIDPSDNTGGTGNPGKITFDFRKKP